MNEENPSQHIPGTAGVQQSDIGRKAEPPMARPIRGHRAALEFRNPEAVDKIIHDTAHGKSMAKLSRETGICEPTIKSIINRNQASLAKELERIEAKSLRMANKSMRIVGKKIKDEDALGASSVGKNMMIMHEKATAQRNAIETGIPVGTGGIAPAFVQNALKAILGGIVDSGILNKQIKPIEIHVSEVKDTDEP